MIHSRTEKRSPSAGRRLRRGLGGTAATFVLAALASAHGQTAATQVEQFTPAHNDVLLLAALDTPNGGPSCALDGVCNLAACRTDPDCPAGVAESANTNSPEPDKDSLGELVLRVLFNLTDEVSSDPARRTAAMDKIDIWIHEAQAIYTRAPRLRIVPYYKHGTVDVPATFQNMNQAKRFMKAHYDNIVGNRKGQGKLVVAVTKGSTTLFENPVDLSDDHGFGGVAYFPDSVRPFALKHGIALNYLKADASLAHELGHIFGLLHTNASDQGLFNKNCNKDFSDRTTRVGKRVNLMDFDGLENGDDVWLNSCQKDKAADHRRRLLTNDGKTNYARL